MTIPRSTVSSHKEDEGKLLAARAYQLPVTGTGIMYVYRTGTVPDYDVCRTPPFAPRRNTQQSFGRQNNFIMK